MYKMSFRFAKGQIAYFDVEITRNCGVTRDKVYEELVTIAPLLVAGKFTGKIDVDCSHQNKIIIVGDS
jgi:hypothetical protein